MFLNGTLRSNAASFMNSQLSVPENFSHSISVPIIYGSFPRMNSLSTLTKAYSMQSADHCKSRHCKRYLFTNIWCTDDGCRCSTALPVYSVLYGNEDNPLSLTNQRSSEPCRSGLGGLRPVFDGVEPCLRPSRRAYPTPKITVR